MDIDEKQYIKRISAGAMQSVYLWASGKDFSSIISDKNFEGSIIRCLRRLQELLKEMSAAANVLGNKNLEKKLNDSIESIRRDIVFAASLYI